MDFWLNIVDQFQHLLYNLQTKQKLAVCTNSQWSNQFLRTGSLWLATALFISSMRCFVSWSILAATSSLEPICFASKSRNWRSRSLRYFSISSWASSLACFNLLAFPIKTQQNRWLITICAREILLAIIRGSY